MKTTMITKLFMACLVLFGGEVFAGPIDDLKPGHWFEVPSSRMSAVDPCPNNNCGYSGSFGQAGTMIAWSGGAFDSNRDRLIIFGGGHGAYGGNEIYTFDVNSLSWNMDIGPSSNINNSKTNTYPDGKPRSRHTYNYIEYVPNIDRFISFGGSGAWEDGGGGFTRDLSAFNFANNSWELNRRPIPSGGSQIGSLAAYDAQTGHVWYTSSGSGARLMEYNPANDSWTSHATKGIAIDLSVAIDPKRRLMVAVGRRDGNRLYVWNLNNPGAAPQELPGTSSGDKTIENCSAPGFQFDPAIDKFVGWCGGSTVYTLDPDTWNWQSITALGGATPTAPNPQGTWGRFRYIPSKNAFIVVNNTDENVYIYKLSDGGGTAPEPDPTTPSLSFSASPTSVTAGESATLTWSTTNATNCSASQSWSGTKPTSGSESIGQLQSDSTFELNCTGAGGTVSRSITVTVSNTGGGSGQSGDWATRSTAPGVVMATRFDTQGDVTNWIAGSASDHVSWDQNLKSSGSGSLRFEIRSSDGAAGGNWSRWLADDQREFGPGDEIFVQYRQYIPAFLATHDFQGGGGWKQSIISRHASSMNGVNQSQPYGSNQLNEIVLQNTNHRGLVQGYNRDSDGKYPPWEVSTATACSNSDFIYQNAVDRGPQNVGTPCENDRARFGGLYSYYQQTPAGYQAGSPDPISGGFKYYSNEWLTFQIHVVLGQYGGNSHDTQVKVYAARQGGSYDLIVNRDDIDLGNGPNHDALWLLPYNTGRSPDSSRQNTFTNYDEVIVSTQFIPAPQSSAGGGGAKIPEPPKSLVVE